MAFSYGEPRKTWRLWLVHLQSVDSKNNIAVFLENYVRFFPCISQTHHYCIKSVKKEKKRGPKKDSKGLYLLYPAHKNKLIYNPNSILKLKKIPVNIGAIKCSLSWSIYILPIIDPLDPDIKCLWGIVERTSHNLFKSDSNRCSRDLSTGQD